MSDSLLSSLYVGTEQTDLVGVLSGVPGAMVGAAVRSGRVEVRNVPNDGPGRYQLGVTDNRTRVVVPELWTVGRKSVDMLADFGRCYGREHLAVLLSVLSSYRLSYDDAAGRGDVYAAWLWVPECLAVLGLKDTHKNRQWWLRLLCGSRPNRPGLSDVHLGTVDVRQVSQWQRLCAVTGATVGRRAGEAVQVVPAAALVHLSGDYHWPVNLARVWSDDTKTGLAMPLWLLCAGQWRAAAAHERELVASFDLSHLRRRLAILGQQRGDSAVPITMAQRVERAAVARRVDPRASAQLTAALETLRDCGEVLRWTVDGGNIDAFAQGSTLRVWCARSVTDVLPRGTVLLPTVGRSLRVWMANAGYRKAVSLARDVDVSPRVVRRALAADDLLISYQLRKAMRVRFCPDFPGPG